MALQWRTPTLSRERFKLCSRSLQFFFFFLAFCWIFAAECPIVTSAAQITLITTCGSNSIAEMKWPKSAVSLFVCFKNTEQARIIAWLLRWAQKPIDVGIQKQINWGQMWHKLWEAGGIFHFKRIKFTSVPQIRVWLTFAPRFQSQKLDFFPVHCCN